MQFKRLTECVCCGNSNLRMCLDLGQQPLANNLLDDVSQDYTQFELKTQLCEMCWHQQLSISVDPALMFDHYVYVSGTSQTLRDYFDWFAVWCKNKWPMHTSVLDIACNDGSQLNSFKKLGYNTWGVDPAQNLHDVSSKSHTVMCAYFDEQVVQQLNPRKLDLIVAQNVVAHTPTPLEFLKNCKQLMHDGSRLLIQTSQAHMVRNQEFDTIYHEHVSFFTVHSMKALVQRAGMCLVNVHETPVHGVSYVFEVALQDDPDSNVHTWLQTEKDTGLTHLVTYDTWSDQAHQLLTELRHTCEAHAQQGYEIWGLGAAAKGIVMLNAAELKLTSVCDENPLKVGKWIPNVNVQIHALSDLQHIDPQTPCVFVCMAWNYLEELTHKVRTHRPNSADKMITYFPEVKVISI